MTTTAKLALEDGTVCTGEAFGAAGEVDLSSLVGQGVFSAWKDPACFASVSIGDAAQLCWTSDIELCADALYLDLTGKSADQVFRRGNIHADA